MQRISCDVNWETLVIEVKENGRFIYEIDLERIHDAMGLLDWFAHLGQKAWMTTQGLGELLRVILDLQVLPMGAWVACGPDLYWEIEEPRKFFLSRRKLYERRRRERANPPPATEGLRTFRQLGQPDRAYDQIEQWRYPLRDKGTA